MSIIIRCELRVQDVVAHALPRLSRHQDIDFAIAGAVGDRDIRDAGKVHVGKPPAECLRHMIAVNVGSIFDMLEHEFEEICRCNIIIAS